jgi:tetratricopeptide (TPR) repeat protein
MHAQDSVDKTANAAYQAKDWLAAQPLYEQLAQSEPSSTRNWYRLGVCSESLGQHEKALGAFENAKAKGLPVSLVGYNIAVALAGTGQSAKAMDELAEAVKQGYAQPDQLTADPALNSIRGDARFPALVEHAKHNQTPCVYQAENRQFDFWVGDWDVVASKGNAPAGLSHIERAIGDCVIWENWNSLGNAGYVGKSYNVYNSSLKRWEQFWVDNQGGMIHFYGGLNQDGVMDFYTDEIPQPDGTKLKRHLQFIKLGQDQVRQFSQGSTDAGRTWNVEYDLTYNRKK